MAKISAALAQLDEAVCRYLRADGSNDRGVTASFAMLGDVIIAEPRALIGLRATRHRADDSQKLPKDFSARSSCSIMVSWTHH